jgi:FkbM family methyltransferase
VVTRRVTAQRSRVRKGDNVWDVGANVGYYALSFSDQFGSSGRVFAFEPSPLNLTYLRRRAIAAENVVVLPFGLSEVRGQLSFREEPDGTTSHIVSNRSLSDANETITVSGLVTR